MAGVYDQAYQSDVYAEAYPKTPSGNAAPVLANIEVGALSFTEGDSATAITTAITVSDADDTDLSSASVVISANYSNGEDVLAFADTAEITGTWVPGTGTMALSGTATLAQYQAALRSITYSNASQDPSTSTRTVSFTVSDGAANSNTATRDITVSAVNDEESLDTNTGATFLEASTDNVITTAMLETTDVDNTASEITYTLDVVPTNGTLYLNAVQLNATDTWTQDDIDSNLLTYDHDGGETSSDSFDFTVDDGTGTDTSGTFSITITAVDDVPALANIEAGTLAFSEGDGPTAITATITAADVDSANLASAEIQITANYASGEDVLAFADANGISSTWVSGTGTLQLTGSSSLANYQAALRAVTFDTADPPTASTRTISFTVNDGSNDSNTVTRDVSVSLVNDPPVLANVETVTALFTEGDTALAITSTLTITDEDDTNIESALIEITGNYASGEDVLAFSNANGISGTWSAGAGTMTLSGASSVANYQAAIRSVTFDTAATVTEGTRELSITVNDGDDDSNTALRNIRVTAGGGTVSSGVVSRSVVRSVSRPVFSA